MGQRGTLSLRGRTPLAGFDPNIFAGEQELDLSLALEILSRELELGSFYSRIAGYEDVNDAERFAQDPTFRLIGSEKTWDRGAAWTSRLQTFEPEKLAEEENFGSLARMNRELTAKAEAVDAQQRIVLDMDSTQISGVRSAGE